MNSFVVAIMSALAAAHWYGPFVGAGIGVLCWILGYHDDKWETTVARAVVLLLEKAVKNLENLESK